MRATLVLVLFGFLLSLPVHGQLQSPDEFLPHKLGEHFTPHHMLVDYYQHVADNSPLVKLYQYGTTNQDRPLLIAIVTSEVNHAQLDAIRLNNLRMTGIEPGAVDSSLSKAICWLSFSVHGNEAAGSESSHQVIYDLVNPDNAKTKSWLENTVVILDPAINPDGYSRYTHWVRNVTMDENNPEFMDIEHQEPWPGGRVNHYLFDLNRDWAWQTQVESQQRLKIYNQWLPHVHADLHEMGHNSPYYFAPAAKPYHKYISQWQRDFQTTIGKNHAKYFDKEGWLYFTKEVFDLFYPSYGDTYPTFSGAIGMTYEQGGSGRGGRGVKTENGEILTLKDRIEHHKTTALSTVEVTSNHAAEVLSQFQDFYKKSNTNPLGQYRSYVIKNDKGGNRLHALAQMLENQGIQYGTVSKSRNVSGLDYDTRTTKTMEVTPGDLVVSAYQPKSVLTQILLDPESELEDSVTYDITAWSLPYAYGLQAMASTQKIEPDADMAISSALKKLTDSYAYIIDWKDLESSKLVSQLLQKGITARVSPKEVSYSGQKFGAGAVIITKADNRSIGSELLEKLNESIAGSNATIVAISTGFAESGPDLGSGQMNLIDRPKVLTVSGDGVSNLAYGQVKWYFDRVIDYPLTTVDVSRLGRVDLTKVNTIVLPEGNYKIGDGDRGKLSKWVSSGGKLIIMGRANRNFVDTDEFGLKNHATEDEASDEKKQDEVANLAARYDHYSDQERKSISGYVPGAIFKLNVDHTHPLGFGLGKNYHSLRTSSLAFPLMVDAENVLTHPKSNGQVIGFAGSKAREKLNDSVAFAVEDKGRGQVVYMVDNPLFRGFWYNGLFLFSNALFLVN